MAFGIFSKAFGPFILKTSGIKSKIAIGTGFGRPDKDIGTARSFEESKLSGVYNGLPMCLNNYHPDFSLSCRIIFLTFPRFHFLLPLPHYSQIDLS
ncbi:LrgB family protein [Salegentibacter sp.]|uniref:LrgB family protein n=1 Tax=Salegentibacter sp. TaxID=1903072 RepID=UPI00356B2895